MMDIAILLASNSPRRKQMMSWTGLKYRVNPVNINEDQHPGEKADNYILRLAEEKAKAAVELAMRNEIILAADTIVVDGDEILGKPKDEADAFRMLSQLKGRVHHVSTAIAVYDPLKPKLLLDKCTSPVKMRVYDDDEIKKYIESKDPFDKAGGYAIQHAVFKPVEVFHDCFAGVMGLPICHIMRTLKKMGLEMSAEAPNNCQTQLQYECPVFDLILNGSKID